MRCRPALLMFSLLLLTLTLPAAAQPTLPPPTPDIAPLQTQIASQGEELNDLQAQVGQLTNFQNIALGVAAFASILGVGSIGAVLAIRRDALKRTQEEVNKAIYQVNPLNAIVRVPQRGFESERRFVQVRKFNRIRTYPDVFPAPDNEPSIAVVKIADLQAEQDFIQFMQNTRPDPALIAYVFYTPSNHRLDPLLTELNQSNFTNYSVANLPATIGIQALNLAVGMVAQPDKS